MWLSDVIRLRINNYIIIDDFFPDGVCDFLREYMLNTAVFKEQYFDYKFFYLLLLQPGKNLIAHLLQRLLPHEVLLM